MPCDRADVWVELSVWAQLGDEMFDGACLGVFARRPGRQAHPFFGDLQEQQQLLEENKELKVQVAQLQERLRSSQFATSSGLEQQPQQVRHCHCQPGLFPP